MPGPLGRLYATFGLDAREFHSGLEDIQGTVARLGGVAQVAGAAIGAGIGTGAAMALRLGDTYDAAADQIRASTGLTGQALADVEGQFQSVAGRVTDDLGLVAAVMGDLRKRSGQTGDALGDLGESILDVSRLTGSDAVSNVAKLTRVYGDWSVAAADQIKTNDKLLRAAQATGIGFDQLAETVVQFGAPMRALGFTFEEGIALLGKWEKEGVNIQTVLSGLRMAVANFAKQGIDPREGIPALVDELSRLDDAQGLLRAKQVVGQRAANDFFRAVREGRFDVTSLVDTIANGSETVQGLSDDTRDLGDGFRELGNRIATAVGPVTSVFAGISDAMGNAIFLLPALGGVLGKGIGKLWQKAAASGAVKTAVAAAGAAAGVIYSGAVAVAEKIMTIVSAAWVAIGRPGSAAIAKAAAAGAASGAAFAGAAGAGGLIGAAGAAIAGMAPLAIPIVFGTPILNDAIRNAPIDERVQNALTGDFIKNLGRRGGQALGEGIEEGVDVVMRRFNLLEGVNDAVRRMFVGGSVLGGFQRSIGALAGHIEGVVSDPIEEEFDDAARAVRDGFGSIKAALANPPQLISRQDRLQNMEARMKKIMRNLHAAVKAEDPANISYWTQAAASQQRRMDRMRGSTMMTVEDIRAAFAKAGVKIDGTWLGIERSAGRRARGARRAAIAEFRTLVGDVRGLNLKDAGTNLIMSWVNGIKAARGAVQTAAAWITGALGKFFHGSAVPKVGPLKGFDKMGADLVDAWVGQVRGRRGRVALAGAEMAGAFDPRAGMPRPALAVGSAGGMTLVIHGNVYGGPAGLRQLQQDIDRAVRPTRRRRD